MNYTVEKGVPLPASQRKGKFAILEELEVGDSFHVSDVTAPAGIYSKAESLGIKVTVRSLLHPSGGFRVWRTA
tara:strand:- start:1531 stop:1749 length:219 start_codon:yes stop_codon:yes gene_type:complete